MMCIGVAPRGGIETIGVSGRGAYSVGVNKPHALIRKIQNGMCWGVCVHRVCVAMGAKGRRSVSVLTWFGEAAALRSRMALPSELPLMGLLSLGLLLASP